jgi:hypothetical protein
MLLRRVLLTLTVCLVFSGVPAEAETIRRVGKEENPGDVFSIWNNSSGQLYFSLRNGNEDRQDFGLGPDEIETFSPVGNTLIRIQTPNGERVYRLGKGRYRLFWNREEGVWDVRAVAPN